MKKLSIIMVAVMVCFCLGFTFIGTGCSDNERKIRLAEVTHSIFYAPLYVALNLGYFEDADLEVELTNANGSDKGMTALLTGAADIGLLGPEAALYVADGGAKNKAICFGQLTQCDGAFIVAKNNTDNFQWSDTVGKTIIGGRAGGMPAMTLQYVIEVINNLTIGTGSNEVNLRTDIDFALTASEFEHSDAEYCTLFEPTASDLEDAGKGYVVASVGEESGKVPYTCFMATQNYLQNHEDVVIDFLKCIMKAIEYLQNATVEEMTTALKPSFTTSSDTSIVNSINSYVSINAWKSGPLMDPEDFDFMQDIIINAGIRDSKIPFNSFVDNSYATKAIQQMESQG